MDYIGLYIYIYDANIGSINDHHWHHIWSMDLKLPSLEWFSWENLEDTIGFTMVLLSNWLRFPVIFPRNQSNEGLIHKSYGNWRYFHHEEFGTIIYHIYIFIYSSHNRDYGEESSPMGFNMRWMGYGWLHLTPRESAKVWPRGWANGSSQSPPSPSGCVNITQHDATWPNTT